MRSIASLWFCLAASVVAGAQGTVSPDHDRHEAVQQAAGEGDPGEGTGIDEAADAKPHNGPYESPYKLTFRVPRRELLFDAGGPRGAAAAESSLPSGEWYGPRARKEFGSWGPPARRFDCPPGVWDKPAEWRRERVVAAAARFIGYEYQHHHIPDWDPPDDWPWKQCCGARLRPFKQGSWYHSSFDRAHRWIH